MGKVYTEIEINTLLGMTNEEIEKRVEEYESDNWHFDNESEYFDCSPVVFLNQKPQSARASFVLPLNEKRAAEAAAEEQGMTFSEFCRKAVKEAVKK